MSFVRPIKEQDLESYIALAHESKFGMTNLPKNPEVLKKNIERSLKSFRETSNELDALYLFVLEDTTLNSIVGVSGIIARAGITRPLDYFRKKEIIPKKLFKEVPSSYPILTRIQLNEEITEICALYLSKKVRHEGYGKLISLSRYFYMADHLERFNEFTFADLRGVILPDGTCPFWDAVGRHFLPIDFQELMHRRDYGHQEIAELMPHFSIYLNLLPREVQDVVGMTHKNTLPALHMLLNQGFNLTTEIDLFDAGPRVIAKTADIHLIQKLGIEKIDQIEENLQADRYLVSTMNSSFRACLAKIRFSEKGVVIDSLSAKLLEADIGSLIKILR